MKKVLIALAGMMTADATLACEPPSPDAFTFEDVATGEYASLYEPGRIIIAEAVGKTFSIEEADGDEACSVSGRHVAFSVAGGKLSQMSFHPVVRDATRVEFDYAKTPGIDATVMINVSGESAGWIALGEAAGRFAYDAPSGKTVNGFGVFARQAEGTGTVRIDNVLVR